jgi:DNA-binding transcriptional MerR regulator
MPGNVGELLEERDAARALAVSAETLRLWRRRGIGPPYVRVGPRLVRYLRDDLASFIRSRRVEAGRARFAP